MSGSGRLCQHHGIATTTRDRGPTWAVIGPRAAHMGDPGRVITGAASALASVVRVDPLVVRLGYVVLAFAGGWGIVAYLATWIWFLFVSPDDPAQEETRVDRAEQGDMWRDLGWGFVVVGLLLQARLWGVGFSDAIVWPVLLVAVGATVAWRRAGAAEVTAWLGGSEPVDGEPEGRTGRTMRFALGGLLVAIGALSMIGSDLTLSAWLLTLLKVAVLLTGVAVMFGPTLRALGEELVDERRRRIRADERALISSHLHDSVLQTLALIQKRSTDPAEVSSLARRQERELRQWLYSEQEQTEGSLRASFEQVAAEVEDRHRIAIDCVVVGDAPLDDTSASVVAATREALVNAAKFSGEPRVSMFADVEPGRIEVFVRDRGVGFDPEEVPDDRRGVADSIVGRMERAGGSADVHSGPGEGTEVHLLVGAAEP
ncbi:MAG TPA: ATP-binding protein [Microthrixaceae bacterium]|nr:ATP-binding protein [Microthrixaceae bacterium]